MSFKGIYDIEGFDTEFDEDEDETYYYFRIRNRSTNDTCEIAVSEPMLTTILNTILPLAIYPSVCKAPQ